MSNCWVTKGAEVVSGRSGLRVRMPVEKPRRYARMLKIVLR
jgi:hypothetical protein